MPKQHDKIAKLRVSRSFPYLLGPLQKTTAGAMEINPANAFRIYGLPIGQLKTYLPRVFAKLAVPAEGDGIVVETYVVRLYLPHYTNRSLLIVAQGQLHQIFMRRGEEGEEGTGWSQFQTVCVECGVFETLLSLVQHPRDDIETAIHCAWDSISWLSFMGNAAQRKILRDKATACNALNICLRVRLCSITFRVLSN